MREIVSEAGRAAQRRPSGDRWRPTHATRPSWRHRVALTTCVALGIILFASEAAPAFTLKLVFPDGQPMTYGTACSGDGCLQGGQILGSTDSKGEISLPDAPDRVIEFRRDGIDLSQVGEGVASGRLMPTGARATVVLSRLLVGHTPAIDAVETDIAARINEARRARGLPAAVLEERLSRAADMQAAWLARNSLGHPLPVLSHVGQYATTLAFRLGAVSYAEPAAGSELAAAGASPTVALEDWLASAAHRDPMLAPGPQLIGVAQVGSVIIVDMHPPCHGCPPATPAPGASGPPARSGTPAAPTNSASSGSGGGGNSGGDGSRAASCGAEQLRVKRLRTRRGRLRLSVGVECLRSGASYKLTIMQRPSRSILRTRAIRGAGTILLALRPSRTTRTLRVKLKRNGRAIAARSIARRSSR